MISTPPRKTASPAMIINALDALLLLACAFGHVMLWISLGNVLHAVNMPCWANRTLANLPYTVAAAGLAGFAWFAIERSAPLAPGEGPRWWLMVYLAACLLSAVATLVARVRHTRGKSPTLLANEATTERLRDIGPKGDRGVLLGRLLLAAPFNESLALDVSRKELRIAELPRDLEGLSITHLSDLHLSGRVGKGYFEEVVRRANGLNSEMIVITGDIVDRRRCIDWIPDTLGRLQARYGVYFILGNHDKPVGPQRVREAMTASGLIDVGLAPREPTIRSTRVLIGGNELPWMSAPTASIAAGDTVKSDTVKSDTVKSDTVKSDTVKSDTVENQTTESEAAFRLLLSHSPDQLAWARRRGFQLMLAGHTHGGQIRFPWLGPLVIPSRFGARYAMGVFHEPPTVMHVSRGVSGLQPLRFNCRPELTQLVLRAGDAASGLNTNRRDAVA